MHSVTNANNSGLLTVDIVTGFKCNLNTGFDFDGFREWLYQVLFQTREQGGHFYYFARSLVYAAVAESQEMDYAPDFLRSPITALAFSQKPQTISKQLYDAIHAKFHEEIEALQLIGMPLTVFIPP